MELLTQLIFQLLFFMVLGLGLKLMDWFYIMKMMDRQNMMECEFNRILENLDEAIICKSDQGITFVNNVG